MPGNNPTFKCPKFHTFLVSSCWILISTSRQRKFVFNAKTGSTPFAPWKHDLRLNCIELVEFVVKLISSKHSLLRRCPSLRCPIRRSSRGMETLIFFLHRLLLLSLLKVILRSRSQTLPRWELIHVHSRSSKFTQILHLQVWTPGV